MQSQVNLAEAAAHFHERALFYLDQKKLDEAKVACEQALKKTTRFCSCLQNNGYYSAKARIDRNSFEVVLTGY